MTTLRTPIIPIKQTFAKVHAPHELDLEGICVFAAIGFFLDQDTYWKDQVVLPAASQCDIGPDGLLKNVTPWFRWHQTPRDLSFEEALEEFSNLYKTIITEQVQNQSVILPLSGGLDSRTQAIALKQLGIETQAYSYQFQNGYKETRIAEHIAKHNGFKFTKFEIPQGYLWEVLDDLSNLNGCYSDFCSPRQMAVLDELKLMPGVFSLGHWGDVLFDDMGVADDLPLEDQAQAIIKKICKRGGLELGQGLWSLWELEGNFYDYFYSRVFSLLERIDIPNHANARMRAFKSLYWAPRWTSVNLSVFKAAHPITLPYYDDRMCEFICSLPEHYLAGRRLQIAYIKQHSPALAKLTWEFYHPFNLFTYQNYKTAKGLRHRMLNSLSYRAKLLLGKPVIQRNWELQFLGTTNDTALKAHLFDANGSTFIPEAFITDYYQKFKTQDTLQYSHAISMLLTLKVWHKTFNEAT